MTREPATCSSPAEKLDVVRRATELLASSRGFDETVEYTLAAFLPILGDFGFFDLVIGDQVRRTARAYDDPRVEGILRPTQWVRQERSDMNLCALSTGRAALHPQIDDAWYRAVAVNDGHLALLRDLAFISMVTVPMRYQGELLGALTLFHGRSGRRHDEDALAFATDLAALAAPVVAHARLLDQQRAAAEALRASEERLRIGMDAGKLGVWDWDIATNRVTWSDRVYDLHGVARDEFTGTLEGFASLVHEDDRARVQGSIEATLRGEDPYVTEFRVPFRDGSVRWLSTRAEVYRDEAGAPVRMIGATYDVTERIELLAATERAKNEAEAASRAKDQFLAVLGHELRNPLAPIVTALHLMEREAPQTFRREREIVGRQVEHVLRLVDDLLDVARLARGKVTLVTERVDLVPLVRDAVETCRTANAGKELDVRIEAGEEPLEVDGDPVRLTQIVANLLANAARFSDRGQSIHVRVAAGPDEVVITVRDEGAGIEPDLLPHVFDLFLQGPQKLERQHGGLGLGLAIVSSLVGLHGGRVDAESAGPGEGATFRVFLPRAGVLVVSERAAEPAAPAAARNLGRVLLVDDNADAAELLAAYLRHEGHEVRIALDGPSALAEADTFVPDVAVLDIGLPGMDGYELARELRRRDLPHLRLIALTGYGLASDRQRSLDAGFDEHLVKPVDPTVLHRLLAQGDTRRLRLDG